MTLPLFQPHLLSTKAHNRQARLLNRMSNNNRAKTALAEPLIACLVCGETHDELANTREFRCFIWFRQAVCYDCVLLSMWQTLQKHVNERHLATLICQ